MIRSAALRFALAASIAASAQAQLQQNLPFTAGIHSWGSPYWTSNVADPAAEAGTVEQLNHVFWLEMHTQQLVLQPGTYIAQVRVQKTTSTAGRFDLAINAESNGTVLASVTLPAASQTVGSYVWSSEVIFTLYQPTPIDVAVRNTSGTQQKQNYRFDTARVGRVPAGPALVHESLDTWGFSNDPYFHHYVAEPTGIYGRVATRDLNMPGLSWLDVRKQMTLATGQYRAKVRLRNVFGPGNGADDLTFEAYDAQFATIASVTIPASAQVAGQWLYSPELQFSLPASTDVTFALFNHNTATSCDGVELDSFCLLPTDATWATFGTGCGGLTLSQTHAAQFGTFANFQLGGAAGATLGAFAFGNGIVPLSLDSMGAVGCKVHVQSFSTLFTLFSASNTSNLLLGIPASTSFLGAGFDMQGAAFVASAPGGLVTSNGAHFTIGN